MSLKKSWKTFKIRTRLDILLKTYIIMIIVFGVTSIIMNSFYPIVFSLFIFSFFVIIAGSSVFIEIYNNLETEPDKK